MLDCKNHAEARSVKFKALRMLPALVIMVVLTSCYDARKVGDAVFWPARPFRLSQAYAQFQIDDLRFPNRRAWGGLPTGPATSLVVNFERPLALSVRCLKLKGTFVDSDGRILGTFGGSIGLMSDSERSDWKAWDGNTESAAVSSLRILNSVVVPSSTCAMNIQLTVLDECPARLISPARATIEIGFQ